MNTLNIVMFSDFYSKWTVIDALLIEDYSIGLSEPMCAHTEPGTHPNWDRVYVNHDHDVCNEVYIATNK